MLATAVTKHIITPSFWILQRRESFCSDSFLTSLVTRFAQPHLGLGSPSPFKSCLASSCFLKFPFINQKGRLKIEDLTVSFPKSKRKMIPH